MAEVKAWITVNGRHIPIMEGESKTQALANHFRKIRKNKNEDFEQKRLNEFASKRNELKNKYDSANGKNAANEYKANVEADLYMKEKYGRKYWAMQQIKGQQNKKFKENQAEKAFSKIRKKAYDQAEEYRKRANEVEEDYEKEYRDTVNRGDRLHARTLAAKRDARYTRAMNEVNQMKLEGDVRAAENYEWRMSKPDRYRASDYRYQREADFGYTDKMVKAGIDSIKDRGVGASRKELCESAARAIRKQNPKARVSAYDNYITVNGNYYNVSHSKNGGWTFKQKTSDNMYNATGANSAVKNAYREYIKQHPNSLMKFETFKKNYSK